VQEAGDDALFVESRPGREGEGVDAVEPVIRRVADQRFDGRNDVGIGGLPQCGEKGLRFSHEKSLRRIAP
jgi:hypothetical protein